MDGERYTCRLETCISGSRSRNDYIAKTQHVETKFISFSLGKFNNVIIRQGVRNRQGLFQFRGCFPIIISLILIIVYAILHRNCIAVARVSSGSGFKIPSKHIMYDSCFCQIIIEFKFRNFSCIRHNRFIRTKGKYDGGNVGCMRIVQHNCIGGFTRPG